jgi:hypothetical protein
MLLLFTGCAFANLTPHAAAFQKLKIGVAKPVIGIPSAIFSTNGLSALHTTPMHASQAPST